MRHRQDRNVFGWLRVSIVAAVLSASMGAIGLPGSTADDAGDVKRLVTVLELREGMTVAEIGAGDGELTLAIARRIGPTGRVFSSELGRERVAKLRAAVESARLANISVIGGASAESRLPERCCDAAFMRDVYHHLTEPAAMNVSLRASLKPCGRLAVLDFAPNAPESLTPAGRSGGNGTHGVTAATVRAELQRAGFDILQADSTSGNHYTIVARRPASDAVPTATCPASGS
jgi:predicted methyltransferase